MPRQFPSPSPPAGAQLCSCRPGTPWRQDVALPAGRDLGTLAEPSTWVRQHWCVLEKKKKKKSKQETLRPGAQWFNPISIFFSLPPPTTCTLRDNTLHLEGKNTISPKCLSLHSIKPSAGTLLFLIYDGHSCSGTDSSLKGFLPRPQLYRVCALLHVSCSSAIAVPY